MTKRRLDRIVLILLCLTGIATAQIPIPKPKAKASNSPAANAPPAAAAPTDTTATPAAPAPPPPPPPDSLGRNTPHGCVVGFLRAAEARDYTRAAAYLDGKRSPEKSQELVVQLKALLDLTDLKIDAISRTPEGNLEDQLHISRERIGTVKTSSGDLDILLDRIERPKETAVWLFSQETLNRVPAVYAGTQHKDLAHYFPEWASRIRFLSVPLWRWGIVLVSVVLCLLLAKFLTRFVVWGFRLVFRKRLTPGVEAAVVRLRGPIFGLMLAFLLNLITNYALTALGRHFWEKVATLAALISGAWLLVRLTDIVASFVCQRLTLQMQIERVTFVGLMQRLFRILVFIILILVLLKGAGVNVSALVAGLGIGGIALALAAQKTLADLFGGISVVMRGAVRVGDFCTVAGRQGTVEEIGISSMRLRTLDRSVISIPNSKVAEVDLENISLRDRFWVHQTFTLQFDTSYSVMKKVLEQILQVLKSRPDVDPVSARTRLIQLTTTGPQIEIFAYYQKPGADYATFLGEQEKIILEVMRIVEEAGTTMAAPVGVVRMDGQPTRMPARTVARSTPVDSAPADR